MAIYSNGSITSKFHAIVKLGGNSQDLGYFESQKDAENAIDRAEAEWEMDLNDASSPPKTIACHDCEGSGKFNGQECNMCAGNGWIAE